VVSPKTKPVDEPTVAIVKAVDVHVPPGVGSLSGVVPFMQTLGVPVIGVSPGLTVTVFVTVQPTPAEYVSVVTPSDNAVTVPVPDPTDPTAGLLLVQRPPVEPLV